MVGSCTEHRGGDPLLDHLMRSLPENQGGPGRHRCPYCAYERGVADERARIARALDCDEEELARGLE